MYRAPGNDPLVMNNPSSKAKVIHALQTLDSIKDSMTAESLRPYLIHSADEVRQKAIRMMRDWDHPERLDILMERIHEHRTAIIHELLDTLCAIGPTAVPVMFRLLTKESVFYVPENFQQVLSALCRCDSNAFANLKPKDKPQKSLELILEKYPNFGRDLSAMFHRHIDMTRYYENTRFGYFHNPTRLEYHQSAINALFNSTQNAGLLQTCIRKSLADDRPGLIQQLSPATDSSHRSLSLSALNSPSVSTRLTALSNLSEADLDNFGELVHDELQNYLGAKQAYSYETWKLVYIVQQVSAFQPGWIFLKFLLNFEKKLLIQLQNHSSKKNDVPFWPDQNFECLVNGLHQYQSRLVDEILLAYTVSLTDLGKCASFVLERFENQAIVPRWAGDGGSTYKKQISRFQKFVQAQNFQYLKKEELLDMVQGNFDELSLCKCRINIILNVRKRFLGLRGVKNAYV